VRSDISACVHGVCPDHHNDNDDVGFRVVITGSGISLFHTQGALIAVILHARFQSNVFLLTTRTSTCGGLAGTLASVVHPFHVNISAFGVICLCGFGKELEQSVKTNCLQYYFFLILLIYYEQNIIRWVFVLWCLYTEEISQNFVDFGYFRYNYILYIIPRIKPEDSR
jgi:hypothetical protein